MQLSHTREIFNIGRILILGKYLAADKVEIFEEAKITDRSSIIVWNDKKTIEKTDKTYSINLRDNSKYSASPLELRSRFNGQI